MLILGHGFGGCGGGAVMVVNDFGLYLWVWVLGGVADYLFNFFLILRWWL